MTEPGQEEPPPSSLLFGAGSVTQGQLVALTSVTLVLLLLLTANMAVCALYRCAVRGEGEEEGEGHRQQQQQQRHRHKAANLWVYRLHRTTSTSPVTESASQQILRKLQLSHHSLQARLAAADHPSSSSSSSPHNDDDSKKRDDSLRREEAQALEELEVTTDLFRHEASSCSSSRRSSLSAFSGAGSSRWSTLRELLLLRGRQIWRGGGVSAFSASRRRSSSQGRSEQRDPNPTLSDLDPDWDFGDDAASRTRPQRGAAVCEDAGSAALPASAVPAHSDPDPSYDLDVAAALADLDMASAMHDLDLDKVSMSSVTFADFENDDPGDLEGTPGKKRTRRSRSRSSSRGSHDNRGDHSRSLPVAEFHNEAFEFSETRAAVERMNDVEL